MAQAPTQVTVITTQPTTAFVQLGKDPCNIVCPNCHKNGMTDVSLEMNWLCCFLFGLWACCVESCKNVEHRCHHCGYHIGTHKPY